MYHLLGGTRGEQGMRTEPSPRKMTAVALLACALVASLIWAAHAAAATQISLDPVSPVPYGGTASVTGTFSADVPLPPGIELSVSVWEPPGVWTTDGTASVRGDGSFAYSSEPLYGITRLLFGFAGDASLEPTSASCDVSVAARLGAPSVPLIVTKGYGFEVTGTLEPRHEAGSYPVILYGYRYEAGGWVRKIAARAMAIDEGGKTRYSVTMSLPYAGTWAVRARHRDVDHADSWSPLSKPVTVRTLPDATIWNRDGVLTVPERMFHRSNARQMVIATGVDIGYKYGTLRFFEYRNGDWVQLFSAPCRFGRNGLINGVLRKTGSLTTPTGIWLMPSYVFGQHSSAPSGTRMPYRHITPRSYWSAVPNATYNTWVESSSYVYGEHLIHYTTTYEWALSTGYNALPNQRVIGRGTAIFLHCYGTGLTAGCVSTAPANMVKVFRLLDPAKRRVFAIGTLQGSKSASIYTY